MIRLIFCDIDGTLLNNEQRIEFIPQDKSHTDNWRKFNSMHIYDQPIGYRIQLLQLLVETGCVVAYVSGRSDEFECETWAQLNLIGAPRGELHMRPNDDNRPAAEYKLETIRRIAGDTQHIALIDDDISVCHAVASAYPHARVIKVPSQDCAYLATAMEVI